MYRNNKNHVCTFDRASRKITRCLLLMVGASFLEDYWETSLDRQGMFIILNVHYIKCTCTWLVQCVSLFYSLFGSKVHI